MPGARGGRSHSPGRRSHSAALPETRFDRAHLHLAIGWLLRSNRLLGGNQRLRSLTAFARALSRHGSGLVAGPSTVSRWETGAQPTPYAAVRRYEELLGLQPSILVSTIDLLHRYFATELSRVPTLARPVGPLDSSRHADLARTVDLVHVGAPVGGQDWDEFSAAMCSMPHILLPRPSTAGEMTSRLLSEMVVADGVAWMQRFEAFCRLASHPVFAEAAVDACARLARDPRNQVFVETVCALDASDHPDAAGHVLGQLDNPTNDRAFLGALLACVRKSQLGHFSPAQAKHLGTLLGELIVDGGLDPSTRRLARRILARLHQHPRSRPGLAECHPAERLLRPGLPPSASEDAERLVSGIQDEANELCVESSKLVDRTMPELVRAALLDPVPDQRLYVGMLLRASPYRTAVADACLRRLDAAPAELTPALVALTRILGHRRHAGALEDLVTDSSRPVALRRTAAFSLGHMEVRPDAEVWEPLLMPATGRATSGAVDREVMAGLVYSAGVAGHQNLLARVPHQRLPFAARTAVTWWRGLPSAVLDSVRS